MRKLQIFAILIFLFGLFIFLFATYTVIDFERTVQHLESLQSAGMKEAQNIDFSRMRAGELTHYAWLAIIGLLSLVSGIGMFLLKNWARRLWIGMIILLAGIHLEGLISGIRNENLSPIDLPYFFVAGVVLFSMWFYLIKPRTKSLFQKNGVD